LLLFVRRHLEILVEVKGARLPTKHVAGEDLTTDVTGSDVMLQETEAMTGALTGALTGLDEILSTTDKLPPAGGDVEERPEEVTFLHDDTFELIVSADPSDLCFAEYDDRPKEDRTTSTELNTILNGCPARFRFDPRRPRGIGAIIRRSC
jgi:hypothetical protein